MPLATHRAARRVPLPVGDQRPLRVLVMSHMHPKVSRGGAEIAAYQLYGALRAAEGVEARFLAASGGRVQERLGARLTQPFGPDEWVYAGAGFDHWLHANPDPEFPPSFAALLQELRPDIVHLHHYTNFGVEALLHIRRTLPEARIVVTLHEYLAICHHFGQMVRRPGMELCEGASPRDCHRCFPDRSEQDFFLRERYIRRFLSLAHHFVSPSRFLAKRYADWGLPQDSLSVIENGMPDASETVEPWRREGDLTLGFFGQISRLKGIDLLFDAAEILARRKVEGVRIEVHGDASGQPPEFREAFEARLGRLPPLVEIRGRYDNARVRGLMAATDAVLVPSLWWENSPLVIQEALATRRPVICSDIGGMAEKVRDGVDGFHFRAGSAVSLAALIAGLAADPRKLRDLQDGLAVPRSLGETTRETLLLYRRLLQAATVASQREEMLA